MDNSVISFRKPESAVYFFYLNVARKRKKREQLCQLLFEQRKQRSLSS